MRSIPILLAILLGSTSLPLAAQEHHHELSAEEVGSVQFATSCAKMVAISFNRAVALLHSFQYEQARAAFTEISRQDPSCAMAQWGVAMSHYHGLWDNGDMNAGRSAIAKAQQNATTNSATTTREKSYISALAEIYKEDGKDKYTHAQVFEQKMSELQAAFPDDSEAAIFHALQLVAIGYLNPTDKSYTWQKKGAVILNGLLPDHRNHPGVAHYIIHAVDYPPLAELGLQAARGYARIAHLHARRFLGRIHQLQYQVDRTGHRRRSRVAKWRSARPTPSRPGLSGIRLPAKRTGEASEGGA